MAEGARLESVYAGNRIEGSNPSLSANFIYNTVQNQLLTIPDALTVPQIAPIMN